MADITSVELNFVVVWNGDLFFWRIFQLTHSFKRVWNRLQQTKWRVLTLAQQKLEASYLDHCKPKRTCGSTEHLSANSFFFQGLELKHIKNIFVGCSIFLFHPFIVGIPPSTKDRTPKCCSHDTFELIFFLFQRVGYVSFVEGNLQGIVGCTPTKVLLWEIPFLSPI